MHHLHHTRVPLAHQLPAAAQGLGEGAGCNGGGEGGQQQRRAQKQQRHESARRAPGAHARPASHGLALPPPAREGRPDCLHGRMQGALHLHLPLLA